MFNRVLTDINQFLSNIGVTNYILRGEDFQGVFIKRLSNSNINNEEKKDLKPNDKRNHQSHLDVPGKKNINFFFSQDVQDMHNNGEKIGKFINIDLIRNNSDYINQIDVPITRVEFKRKELTYKKTIRATHSPYISSGITGSTLIECRAILKLGHESNVQVQINTPVPTDRFNQFRKKLYKNDILVLLKKDEDNFVGIAIPSEDLHNYNDLQFTMANTVILNGGAGIDEAEIEEDEIEVEEEEIEEAEVVDDINKGDGHKQEETVKEDNTFELDTNNLEFVLYTPPFGNKTPSLQSGNQRRARKKDYDKANKTNGIKGTLGEEAVVINEKEKLISIGRQDLADTVEWVSKTKGDGLGYDIESWKVNGQIAEKMYIEVKTTTGPISTPFEISANEVEVSKELGDKYYIYRIFGIEKITTKINFYIINGDITKHFELIPSSFKAYLNTEDI
ncbi:DUF3883 domain-containing protein [Clostridium sp. CF012]|uniref:DUF3883 domain-containing protein n=1 Tax=Clostridium sp. CF012 TaxID=2843319 RepID=UPI001C0D22E3|nr:DUF3883 domain-containing protein [Clostridium sp. CF012]MBU3144622.1 DUF3883 domain-containing protein [Clostridium sp. CF012]